MYSRNKHVENWIWWAQPIHHLREDVPAHLQGKAVATLLLLRNKLCTWLQRSHLHCLSNRPSRRRGHWASCVVSATRRRWIEDVSGVQRNPNGVAVENGPTQTLDSWSFCRFSLIAIAHVVIKLCISTREPYTEKQQQHELHFIHNYSIFHAHMKEFAISQIVGRKSVEILTIPL